MEANGRKRRGFMKGKLMPFYKLSSKPSSTSGSQFSSTKTKQTGLVGYVFHQDYCISHHNVAFLVQETTGRDTATRDSLSQFDNPYGIVADEGVDIKAANYISSTQARFKLERVNSDRKAAAVTAAPPEMQ